MAAVDNFTKGRFNDCADNSLVKKRTDVSGETLSWKAPCGKRFVNTLMNVFGMGTITRNILGCRLSYQNRICRIRVLWVRTCHYLRGDLNGEILNSLQPILGYRPP